MSVTRHLPLLLIISRLVMGLVIVALALWLPDGTAMPTVVLLTLGLLSDVFDGIIARRLGISTTRLRRLDSSVDQVFFLSVAMAAYMRCPVFFKMHATLLLILLATEALTYIVSFIKFRKEIATHSIGAKIWTLFLFGTLVQIILQCESGLLFQLCFWIGMITRLEIILIILILRSWTNDVPSVYHALLLRRHKDISRNKWLNG